MIPNLTDDEGLLYQVFRHRDPTLTDLRFATILLHGSAKNFTAAQQEYERDQITAAEMKASNRTLHRHAAIYVHALLCATTEAGDISGDWGWFNVLPQLIQQLGAIEAELLELPK